MHILMESVNQLEDNVIESFKLVKEEISKLKERLNSIVKNQSSIIQLIEQLERKELLLNQKLKTLEIKRTIVNKIITINKTNKSFLASKKGKKFHEKNCPFGKNIKPKMRLIFKTKNSALNKGFKPCKCVRLK